MNGPYRRTLIWAACAAGLAFSAGFARAAEATAAETRKPNIVFIFSDDYGIPGVGCYGGKYATPNLDSLAKGGLRFQNCFAMPLCGPSRAVTLSGQYPFRNGVLNNGMGRAITPQSATIFPKMLKQAGYATAAAGKWRQLQYFETVEDGRAWGFDEFMVWGAGHGERYWDPDFIHNGRRMTDNAGKYGPDVLQQFVFDFMQRHRDDPFFIYYPTPLVHGPILTTPDSKSSDKSGNEKTKSRKERGKSDELYADNVAYLDKLVGNLVAELDRLGLRENTLIVFTGDNGSTGNNPLTIDGREIIGRKGRLLEGGSRVPLIVNWAGVTPAGKVLDDLVDFSDFYVTFAELAGATLPAGMKLDGRSFAPQIRGQQGHPRDSVFVQLHNRWYARDKGWKLTDEGQLFDMSDAPFAEKPVAADSSDAAAQAARQRLQSTLVELNPAGGKTAPQMDKAKKQAKQAKRKKRKASAT